MGGAGSAIPQKEWVGPVPSFLPRAGPMLNKMQMLLGLALGWRVGLLRPLLMLRNKEAG